MSACCLSSLYRALVRYSLCLLAILWRSVRVEAVLCGDDLFDFLLSPLPVLPLVPGYEFRFSDFWNDWLWLSEWSSGRTSSTVDGFAALRIWVQEAQGAYRSQLLLLWVYLVWGRLWWYDIPGSLWLWALDGSQSISSCPASSSHAADVRYLPFLGVNKSGCSVFSCLSYLLLIGLCKMSQASFAARKLAFDNSVALIPALSGWF